MNLREEYEKNKEFVLLKTTSNPDLFILKYKRSVFYSGKWNDFLRECRGLVVDKDFNVVSYGFTKIHNFRVEPDAPDWTDDTEVSVVRKVNGFMCTVSSYNGELVVSTTGSIDSDFAKLARSYISKELESLILNEFSGMSCIFECCDETDPHIVAEAPGLYFLGMRKNEIGSKIAYHVEDHEFWADLGVRTLITTTKTVGEVMYDLKQCRHEGYVMYRDFVDQRGNSRQEASKCKSPHYLVKKLFMRGDTNKLLDRNIKRTIPEEYFRLVDHIKVNREEFVELSEQSRRKFIEAFIRGCDIIDSSKYTL